MPHRHEYAAALGRVTQLLLLGGGFLVRPPRLRPRTCVVDFRRVRFDDGIWERFLPIDARNRRRHLVWAHAGVRRRAVVSARWPNAVNTVAGANAEFWRGTVLGDGSAAREAVRMPGQESKSVSDVVQGEWETREVYLAGGRLSPSESLAVTRHSAHGFGWCDGGSGAAQLALALLLRATDRASAVAHYQAFKWEVIARLPRTDFTLAISTVRDWLASRSAP